MSESKEPVAAAEAGDKLTASEIAHIKVQLIDLGIQRGPESGDPLHFARHAFGFVVGETVSDPRFGLSRSANPQPSTGPSQ